MVVQGVRLRVHHGVGGEMGWLADVGKCLHLFADGAVMRPVPAVGVDLPPLFPLLIDDLVVLCSVLHLMHQICRRSPLGVVHVRWTGDVVPA